MPKLLTTKRPKARPSATDRKPANYQVPHSPFQKLVDARRLALDLSFADLAERLTDLTGLKTNRGSVWIWIHSANGYPSKRSCTPKHLAALGKILSVPLDDLKQALDASRRLYTDQEQPISQDQYDAFETALTTLRGHGRRYIQVSQVVNLLERLRAGIRPAPEPQDSLPSGKAAPRPRAPKPRRSK